jgi:hypothetical protein
VRPTSEFDTPTTVSRERDINDSEMEDIFGIVEDHGADHEAVRLPLDEAVIEAAKVAVRPNRNDFHTTFVKHGYTALIDAARFEAKEAGHELTHSRDNTDLAAESTWRALGLQIFASMPRTILTALIDGSLIYKVETKSDVNLAEYFDSGHPRHVKSRWATRSQESFAPKIYMCALVDKDGRPPSRTELGSVITTMRRYISGDRHWDNLVVAIDRQSNRNSDLADVENGMHHHLGLAVRAQYIETFVQALINNVKKYDPDAADGSLSVLRNPLKYFGVTMFPAQRAQQHSAQSATNRLMSLVVDVCQYLFRLHDNTPKFTIKTYTVAHLVNPDECRLAEELFTRMCGGYYYTGRGFNVASAGSSIKEMSAARINDCEAVREELGFLHANIEREASVDIPAYTNYLEGVRIDVANRERQRQRKDRRKEQLKDLRQTMVPAAFYRRERDRLHQQQRELESTLAQAPYLTEAKEVFSHAEEQFNQSILRCEQDQAVPNEGPLPKEGSQGSQDNDDLYADP